MKIKDLILELSKFNPDTRVCLIGYEGGVYNPTRVLEVIVALDVNDEWYYGPHEELVPDLDRDYPDHVHETMVRIS